MTNEKDKRFVECFVYFFSTSNMYNNKPFFFKKQTKKNKKIKIKNTNTCCRNLVCLFFYFKGGTGEGELNYWLGLFHNEIVVCVYKCLSSPLIIISQSAVKNKTKKTNHRCRIIELNNWWLIIIFSWKFFFFKYK